jgi:hypothetical protein
MPDSATYFDSSKEIGTYTNGQIQYWSKQCTFIIADVFVLQL